MDLATAARELLDHYKGLPAVSLVEGRLIANLREALAQHAPSREVHPLALAYLEASARVFSERFNPTGTPTPAQAAREDALGEWVRDGLKLYDNSVPLDAEQATSWNAPAPHETHRSRDGIDMGHGESWSVDVLRCRWCAYTFEPHQGAEFAEHVKERHPQWAAQETKT